jgi:hypothetical protein
MVTGFCPIKTITPRTSLMAIIVFHVRALAIYSNIMGSNSTVTFNTPKHSRSRQTQSLSKCDWRPNLVEFHLIRIDCQLVHKRL